MKISAVTLYLLNMPMREPFAASHGVEHDKRAIIVELETDTGAVGYAECVAGLYPHYTEETAATAWVMLRDWLVPACLGLNIESTADIARWYDEMASIRGNRMAKAGLEMAMWDALSADLQIPLVTLIGGIKRAVPVGISVGLQPTVDALITKVAGYVEQGFQRVKLKVEPGRDKSFVREVRSRFPDLPLMVDANSAYESCPFEDLMWLDDCNLLMVEQPLAFDDIVHHAELQQQLQTPVCLDESIRSAADVIRATSINACKIVNVKPGRVGGFTECLRLHEASLAARMQLWCGGMLETGIGRLHNIVLSALPGFTLPGDTAPSERYFREDLVDPPVSFSDPGWLPVEPLCGVAGRVRRDRLLKWSLQIERFS